MLQQIRGALGIAALILISLAYLSYEHLRPWVTFNSEMLTCLAAIIALVSLSTTHSKLPLRILPLFAIACIPLIQHAFGLVFFMGSALLSSSYLFLFASMVVVGYNAAFKPQHAQLLMQAWCYTLLFVGVCSTGIAITQWLQQEQHFFYMMGLSNNRPYANFAQPNNLSTALVMALLANLYLVTQRKLPLALAALIALVLLFGISLTQSRTAWLALPFMLCYWSYSRWRMQRLNRHAVQELPQQQSVKASLTQNHLPAIQPLNVPSRYLGLTVLVFVLLVMALPTFNAWLNQWLGVNAIQTASAVARAGGGHERLVMWQQMFAALQLQPWQGYGWGQVAVAQAQVLTEIPLKIWFNSSHNLFIDLLVVNGLPLGLSILAFLLWWLWQLHRAARSSEAVIALMMVAAILIHAMLEYPQRYAYFLLPMGLLLGIAQAQQHKLRMLSLPRTTPVLLALLAVALWGLIWRDYSVGLDNIKAARLQEQQRLKQTQPQYEHQPPYIAPQRLYVLDQFWRTAHWVSLNPFNRVSAAQIQRYGQVVVLAPSRKNLYKYAQLLAYNGQHAQARQQLKILYTLYGVQVDEKQLLQRDAL